MQPIVFGNASVEGANNFGWFLGHFVSVDNPRSTSILEVKWAVHTGEGRIDWAMNSQATTLSILIAGQFRLQFPEQEFLLYREGDYVLWLPGVPHSWAAQTDSTILTVR